MMYLTRCYLIFFRMKLCLFVLCISASSMLAQSDDPNSPSNNPYTISFFQFDPKSLGAGKKQSKKDIKPSDINGPIKNTTQNNATLSNSSNVDAKNSSVVINEALLTLNNTISANNNTVPITNTTLTNSTIVNNSTSSKNMTSQNTKRNSVPSAEDKLAIEREFYRKSNVLNPNPKPSVQLAGDNLKSPNYQTLTAGYPHSIASTSNGVLMANKIDKSANDLPLKSPVVLYKENKTALSSSSSGSSQMTNSVTLKQVNSPVPARNKTSSLPKHRNSTTAKLVAKQSNSLIKTGNHSTKQNSSAKHNVTSKHVIQSHTNTVVVKSDVARNMTEQEAKQAKLEKDKRTNQQIQQAAKKIPAMKNDIKKPVNSVKKPVFSQFSQAAELNKRNYSIATQQQNVFTDDDSDPDDFRRSKVVSHRKKVAKFVPLYKNISKKDRNLSFQRGLMKHPKHNTYPKCHQCPHNSTYAQCVKQSTLKDCNKDLDNICFTKSTKKYGIVSYEMGCSNHKQCGDAKAFPCKDGSKQCFTCCQFDRCNSSPHHGDFELDSLNMDELVSLDASQDKPSGSSCSLITSEWLSMTAAITINLFIIIHLGSN